MATIELYVKPAAVVGSSGGNNGNGFASHQFLIYRDSAGVITGYSRGGPEIKETFDIKGPGPFGYIVTNYGEYNRNTLDYIPNLDQNRGKIVFSGSDAQVDSIKIQDYKRLDEIRELKIPYTASKANSNSVVGTLLKENNIPVPDPSTIDGGVSVPGYNTKLYDFSDQIKQRKYNVDTWIEDDATWREFKDKALNYAVDVEEAFDGQQIVSIFGDAPTLNLNNAKILLAGNAKATITGSGNDIYGGKDAQIKPTGGVNTLHKDTNGDGQFDRTEQYRADGTLEIVKGNDTAGNAFTELFDGLGTLSKYIFKGTNGQQVELTGDMLGSSIGSSIGGLIGGGNFATKVVSTTIIGALGQSVGGLLSISGNGGKSLIAVANGTTTLDMAFGEVFNNLGPNILHNLGPNIIGGVSSLLTAQLADALNLHGFAGGLFNTVGTAFTSQNAANDNAAEVAKMQQKYC